MAGDSGGSVRKDGESGAPIQGERQARRRRADGTIIFADIVAPRMPPGGALLLPAHESRRRGGTLADPALQGML
jgi:hypothetical protein